MVLCVLWKYLLRRWGANRIDYEQTFYFAIAVTAKRIT